MAHIFSFRRVVRGVDLDQRGNGRRLARVSRADARRHLDGDAMCRSNGARRRTSSGSSRSPAAAGRRRCWSTASSISRRRPARPRRATFRCGRCASTPQDGRILWDVEAIRPDVEAAKIMHQKNSLASATPIVDGDRIYVHFGHMGTAALDLDGQGAVDANGHRLLAAAWHRRLARTGRRPLGLQLRRRRGAVHRRPRPRNGRRTLARRPRDGGGQDVFILHADRDRSRRRQADHQPGQRHDGRLRPAQRP